MPGQGIPVKHLAVEMRFDPSLLFYAVMDKIGLEMAEGYPEWERSPLTLEIRNKKSHRRCYLSSQRCFYEALDFLAVVPEMERAKKLFDKVHHELKFTKVRRVGFRQWLTAASEEPLAQMVKRAVKKLTSPDDHLHKLIRGRIEDVGYTVDVLSDSGWKYVLKFGPMEKKQWFELIPHELGIFESPEDFKNYQNQFPERFYFLDIDCAKDAVTFSDVAQLLLSMQQGSAEILADFIQYIKE